MTLLLGGHETTAIHCMIWYVLFTYPDVEKKLHEERTPFSTVSPNTRQIPQLRYLDLLLKKFFACILLHLSLRGNQFKMMRWRVLHPKNSYVFVLPLLHSSTSRLLATTRVFTLNGSYRTFSQVCLSALRGGPHICIGNSFAEWR